MLGVASYWVLVAVAGALVVDAFPFEWRPVERWAAAAAIGMVGSTIVSFGLSFWFGVGAASALLGPSLLICPLLALRGRTWWARIHRAGLRPRLARWSAWSLETRWATVVAGLLGLCFWLIFRGAIYPGAAGSLLANGHVWADWSVHTSYVQSFLLAHNLPPSDSLEAGTAMRYPFLVDFQPALLEAVGQNLYGSLDMASFVIGWAATVLIWHLAVRVTARPAAASIVVMLVLLGGGLGFAAVYPDGCQQLAATHPGYPAAGCTTLSSSTPTAVLGFFEHLPVELTHLPRSYDGEGPAPPALPDLQWYTPLLTLWMPQRDLAYGMALVAVILSVTWESLRSRRTRPLAAAGALGAALPFLNPFGYLVVGLVGLWWLGRRGWTRGLLAFEVPLAILGMPQLWFVASGPHGQLGGPVGTNLFPQLDLGWLSHAATACTAGQFQSGAACDSLYLAGASPLTMLAYLGHTLSQPGFYPAWLGFWLSNTGVFCLLALLVVWLALVPDRLGRQVRDLRLVRFAAPFWCIFLIANVIVTQPWNWDNTKLLSYWYLGAAIPVAWLLTSGRRLWSRALAGVALATLILAGVLSLDVGFIGQSNLSGSAPVGASASFATPAAQLVAAAVAARTPVHSVFLTEGQPNDPVTTLAGRSAMLAYDGWLWSYGQPLTRRYRAAATIYRGCQPGRRCQVGALLRRYRVGYIEFEPGDYNNLLVDESWFRAQHLPVVVNRGGYLILKVTRLWSAQGDKGFG
jgi:hypothetical protein